MFQDTIEEIRRAFLGVQSYFLLQGSPRIEESHRHLLVESQVADLDSAIRSAPIVVDNSGTVRLHLVGESREVAVVSKTANVWQPEGALWDELPLLQGEPRDRITADELSVATTEIVDARVEVQIIKESWLLRLEAEGGRAIWVGFRRQAFRQWLEGSAPVVFSVLFRQPGALVLLHDGRESQAGSGRDSRSVDSMRRHPCPPPILAGRRLFSQASGSYFEQLSSTWAR